MGLTLCFCDSANINVLPMLIILYNISNLSFTVAKISFGVESVMLNSYKIYYYFVRLIIILVRLALSINVISG